jgi:RimJ/RimL family protein N-acetyltransferase
MDEIRTERLILRPARAADLEDMHAVLSNGQAMRFWSTVAHTDREQTREWLDRMIFDSPAERVDFVIEFEGRAIGKAGCWRLPQIGFILHPDHWGRGYAREAVEAVIAAIFERLPIPEITADVDPRNRASLALLQRLGFEKTATARRTWFVGGEWCDSIYLALPRPGSS